MLGLAAERGAFSIVVARYRIIPDIQRGDLKPKLS